MAFWNKNKLPAEFKDMTEDQIAEHLLAGRTAADQAAAEKARADKTAQDLAARETELTSTRTKLTELEQRMSGSGNEGGNQNQNQNQNQGGTPDVADWITDPNKAFNQMAAGTQAVALHGAIMSAMMYADQQITQMGPVDARLWKKYRGEVERIMATFPPEQRILPQTWINQFIYIKGFHANDIIKEAQGQGDAFFSETAATTGAGLNSNTVDANAKKNEPDEHDRRMAQKYGIPIERYMKTKSTMVFGPAV
jgi:hypothetical protein